ncbi:MBL fold metallo-hydrolase [Fulvivirga sp. 29W222]|uniref:MBL fold metallo-hydrolase n=1 Tax=Fulvivirga marina TaxID=2494733 RepID=A0A937KDY7_9BACT|nr:MBL fold metallo-hydrolase [Fulvivirga marina]MBL6449147.1 MBL fold metallo-hydrolase [Fulvivirga marina]
MSNKKVYLKSNVVPEPLFEGWYAWSHLISPATAARNITDRHLKIINSYIQAPQIHAAAVKNPKMLGGPFMDFNGVDRKADVEVHKQQILERQQKMIELSDAIKELNSMLMNEAKGYSLEPLYEKVPDILKGYVELTYDTNNQPSYRFFESLLYKSEYYDDSYQSIALYLIEEDDRPFVLSTPRLSEEGVIHLRIPFNHKGIDELFKMQRVPNSYEKIRDELGISPEDEEIFKTFFTETPPKPYEKYEGEGIRTRYFGHACILVETKDVSILADPVISYGYDSEISRYTYTDLPDEIDFVLITHNHQDHILFETLLQLRHKIKHIIVPRNGSGELQDPNLKLMFNHLGFDNVIELSEMDSIKIGDCEITGLPFLGEHADLNIATKLCHHVKFEDKLSVLFAADSCNIEPKLYEHVQKVIGNVDVLFLGMECDGAPLSWLYGPLITEKLDRDKDQSRRLAGSNYERGMHIVDQFSPKETYVYAMGQEPWLNYIMTIKYTPESNPIIASNKLIEDCKTRGTEAERLFGEKEIFYN